MAGIEIQRKQLETVKPETSVSNCEWPTLTSWMESTVFFKKNVITETVTIYADSQAALKSIKFSIIIFDEVLRCRTPLYTIRLCWVHGHYYIEGNVKSYELARIGSQSTELEVADMLKPPPCHFDRALEVLFGLVQRTTVSKQV